MTPPNGLQNMTTASVMDDKGRISTDHYHIWGARQCAAPAVRSARSLDLTRVIVTYYKHPRFDHQRVGDVGQVRLSEMVQYIVCRSCIQSSGLSVQSPSWSRTPPLCIICMVMSQSLQGDCYVAILLHFFLKSSLIGRGGPALW